MMMNRSWYLACFVFGSLMLVVHHASSQESISFSSDEPLLPCVYRGVPYLHLQSWLVDECTTCTCHNATTTCRIDSCQPAFCVEPVRPSGKCCYICPYDVTVRKVKPTMHSKGNVTTNGDATLVLAVEVIFREAQYTTGVKGESLWELSAWIAPINTTHRPSTPPSSQRKDASSPPRWILGNSDVRTVELPRPYTPPSSQRKDASSPPRWILGNSDVRTVLPWPYTPPSSQRKDASSPPRWILGNSDVRTVLPRTLSQTQIGFTEQVLNVDQASQWYIKGDQFIFRDVVYTFVAPSLNCDEANVCVELKRGSNPVTTDGRPFQLSSDPDSSTPMIGCTSLCTGRYTYPCLDKEGRHLHEDVWQLDPCTRCTCNNGTAACATKKCPYPGCNRPVRRKSECCLSCLYQCPDKSDVWITLVISTSVLVGIVIVVLTIVYLHRRLKKFETTTDRDAHQMTSTE